jgi:hypothetical protein
VAGTARHRCAEYAAWLLEWAWVLPVGLIPFFFLLFPDGRLPSRRWRPVAWLALLAPLLVVVGQGFAPGPLDSIPSVPNPLGIPGAEWLSTVAFVGESVLGALALLAAFAAFLVRFRASQRPAVWNGSSSNGSPTPPRCWRPASWPGRCSPRSACPTR